MGDEVDVKCMEIDSQGRVNLSIKRLLMPEEYDHFPLRKDFPLAGKPSEMPDVAFSKTAPANGATSQPTSLTLSWGTSSDATSYEYCYDTGDNNACDTSWISTGTSTIIGLSGLTIDTTYYWQVKAINPGASTLADGGTWWNFTTPSSFTDIYDSHWALTWIERLYNSGITTGCNPALMLYCPAQSVTRAQMAAFLLRAKHGAAYDPPAPVGIFTDVPTSHWAAKWIEQLYAEGITTGCDAGLYCPEQAVTRAQMAAFLVRTFELP